LADPNYLPLASLVPHPVALAPVAVSPAKLVENARGRDDIVLIRTTNTEISVGSFATSSLLKAIQHVWHTAQNATAATLRQDCLVLGGVIDRLKAREEYNNHYREYLLGNLSEEEFEDIAGKFAYTPNAANLVELSAQINALLTYTTHDFTKDEVAELLQVSDEDVNRAVTQLPLFGSPDSA
jgi:hypothetical protein